MLRRSLFILCVFGLISCSGGEATTVDDESPPNDEETSVEPTEPVELTPAEELAARVLERAGADDLSQAKEIRFTFVVSTKGEEVFRARHRYNRVANTDRITWINPDSPVGKRFDLLIDLDDKHVEGKVDGQPIADGQRKRVKPLAYQRWVNDFYWYAMPLKLRDPGVELEKLADRQWNDQTYEVLEMTFSGVGLTPGDRYVLYVHPELDRIERWDMDLQASDGEPVQVARTNFEERGPLYLSHEHVWINGNKRVDIRDVEVSDTVERTEFSFDDSDFEYDAFPELGPNDESTDPKSDDENESEGSEDETTADSEKKSSSEGGEK